VHPGESSEKISLSERFGLVDPLLPVQPLEKRQKGENEMGGDEYLSIVAQWLRGFDVAGRRGPRLPSESLVWALVRVRGSGRVAFQFGGLSAEGTTREARSERVPVEWPSAS